MMSLPGRLRSYFRERAVPPVAFQASRAYLSGIHFSRKDKRFGSHFVLPLPEGAIEPSFDKKNILNAGALEEKVREGLRRLRTGERMAGLLLPEFCFKVFVFSFENFPGSFKERDALLRWRLSKAMPISPSDLRLAYDCLASDGQAKVFLVAARSAVVREYEDLFARCGLHIGNVGIPALHLVNLLKKSETDNALVVNAEPDSVSLTAVLDGAISLYRFKPFLTDPLHPVPTARKFETIVNEVENTVHFIEDREKKRVAAVWVRNAIPDGQEDPLAVLKGRASLPWRPVEPGGPPMAGAGDRQILATLIGLVS